jgi:hypothetical protein
MRRLGHPLGIKPRRASRGRLVRPFEGDDLDSVATHALSSREEVALDMRIPLLDGLTTFQALALPEVFVPPLAEEDGRRD